MELESEITKFYTGKKILITGASGFIGKVLLWKLLHSCSSIDTIYVLIRSKRGQGVQSRVESILKTPIYDDIRKSNASLLEKVVAIHGDISEDGLDLSAVDKDKIINQVSIVFHIAAALNMDADLKTAVNMNTLGPLRMLQLGEQMKNLEAFVHTSTAYCYCEQKETEEVVIAPFDDPYNIIHLTKWISSDLLHTITAGLITPHPNTYTYTKRLAEKIVADYYPQLPVIIARPSIVIPSLKEPIPGWVDNVNGPIGILMAAGKGVCRSMLCDGSTNADVVTVDRVANSLVAVVWKTSMQMKLKKPEKIPVLNITSAETKPILWSEIIDYGKEAVYKYPFSQVLWYPGGGVTTDIFIHWMVTFFFQWLPAYILDALLMMFGHKPFLVHVQKRILQGQKVLQYFTTRVWKFSTKNITQLKESMNSLDQATFPVTMVGFDDRLAYIISALKGTRKYILKEDDATLPQCRSRMKMLYVVDCIARFCAILFVFWLGSILVSIVVQNV